MSVICFEQLTHYYGRRRGIEDLSLEVGESALFGFLGPNGAGKTTTIRVLLGFLRATRGTAKVFGQDTRHDSKAIKREIGYLPGDVRLPPWMNGATALSIFGAVRGLDLKRSGRELAERFDLDLRVKVRAMSRGMRQKLAIILALAHSPRLLVLDEPTNSLDPLMQEALHKVLRQMAAAGHTIFFSSHSLSEVDQLCEHVAIVRDGKLVANESLATLRKRAGHDVTIRWKPDTHVLKLEPPSFLKLVRREGAEWQGVLEGPAHPLVEFLAGKPVEELTIARPNLESLFRRFYEHQERRG